MRIGIKLKNHVDNPVIKGDNVLILKAQTDRLGASFRASVNPCA